MQASYTELVNRFHQDILWRDPYPEDFARYTTQLRSGNLSPDQLREALMKSPERERFIDPLVADIRAAYTKFLFREPSPRDIRRHLNHFRNKFPSLEEAIRVVEGGGMRPHLGIRPLKLEMDVTTQCNIRCIMCYLSDPRFSKIRRVDISVEDFERIAEQVFPLCYSVSLSMSTEPLLHKNIGWFVATAKQQYGVEVVHMYTNGLLLHQQLIDHFIEAALDRINVSIDGATKPTYERIRRGASFDKLIANIQALNRAKGRLGSPCPVISFGFVMMRSNIEELPLLIQLAHDLQVREVDCIHVTLHDGFSAAAESLDKHKALCNRMMDEARTLAGKYHIVLTLPEPFDEACTGGPLIQISASLLNRSAETQVLATPVPPEPIPSDPVLLEDHNRVFMEHLDVDEEILCCPFPWHFIGIDPYGNVFPCGWWYHDGPLGNIRKQSLEEIWNNDLYRALRAEHLGRRLRHNCQTCPAAGPGNVNDGNAFVMKTLLVY
jgi:radical SAM protein with 4Fe4S-binding SPASM domain